MIKWNGKKSWIRIWIALKPLQQYAYISVWCDQFLYWIYFSTATLPYQCCPLHHPGPLYSKPSYNCFKHAVKWIVWNSVSMSHDFACVMVISLNLLCWNAILSSGKRRKSHCQIWWVEKAWNDIHLFLATKCAEWAGVWHEFGGSSVHIQVVPQNPLNSPKRNSQHISNFTYSHYFAFWGEFPHWIHVFPCLAHRWMSQVSRGQTTFDLGKPLKNVSYSCCLLSKSYFKCFKSFHSIFS